MGCDIHAFTETRDANGNWVSHSRPTASEYEGEVDYLPQSPGVSRNYWLFGTLAQVRCEWPWSFDRKGFPEDASPEVAADYERWDSDAHSPSYLTRRELQEKATELLISSEAEALDNAGYLREVIADMPPHDGDPEDQRLVFWFDN